MPIVLSCGWDHKSFDGGKEVKESMKLPKKCPYCASGVLQRWGSYQRSYVVDGHDLKHQIKIVRMRCKCCGKTVAVLPEFLAPYQRVVTKVREAIVQARLSGKACDVWRNGRASASGRSVVG
mgnify:FL=1